MDTTKHILLFFKKLRGELKPEEQRELLGLEAKDENKSFFKNLEEIWERSGQYKQGYEPDVEAGLARFQQRLAAEKNLRPEKRPARRMLQSWRAAAATLALLAMAGWWLWQNQSAPVALAYATAAGEVLETKLPDGSQVILNEHTSLQLPASFEGLAARNVQLNGEAYFKVAHQADAPFIIQTPEATVEVLGTAFNLRAYPNESFTEVEVQEGRVRFTQLSSQRVIELQAGERGIFYHNGEVAQQSAPALNALAWHTHRLEFRNVTLQEALPAIERYYKVKLELRNLQAASCSLSMAFSQESLQGVLDALKLIYGFSISQAADNYYILSQGGC
jgi:transmembrane sensor